MLASFATVSILLHRLMPEIETVWLFSSLGIVVSFFMDVLAPFCDRQVVCKARSSSRAREKTSIQFS